MIGNRPRYALDLGVLFPTIALIVIGAFNLYSATSQTAVSKLFVMQLIWIAVGIVAMAVVLILDYRIFERIAYFIYGFMILLLGLVLVVGTSALGAKRWLALGPVHFQPSDPMKIALILALAKYFHNQRRDVAYRLRELVVPFVIIGVPAFLILVEPDLGTTLLLCFIAMAVIMFMKIRWQSLLILVVLALIAIPITWKFVLKDYQKGRIETFLNPASDPKGKGYHSIQSMIAVGSGQLWGKGYRKGTQTQLKFLPEQHTDFIFSVFAEEHGFFGSLVVILLYLALLGFGIRVASRAKEKFGAILGLGCVSILFWHMLINIGMITGIMPVVGVPLPFMSYGGSSLVTSMIAVGLLLNISMRRFIF
ncbi:rod shape-determining protein RodA [Bdellovibrionota bacterium]